MKKLISFIAVFGLLVSMLSGCGKQSAGGGFDYGNMATATDLGNDSTSFGESLEDLNAYAGYFEEDIVDVSVSCISGTEGCYTLEGNTLTFTSVGEDTVYSVSGQLKGNIVIDTGDDYKFDLEMQGLSLVSDAETPILVLSGKEVSLTAKVAYENYIYDMREAVSTDEEANYSGAIYSAVDLKICGKGNLVIVSENNNGIHSKDDLEVKNLTLLVACTDNALKGNDSVEITGGETILIATQGDGIKTTNSDISQKGNQRGTVTIEGGTHSVYAACDGIDASYNVVIDEETTELNIYTDKYSNYSTEVTAVDEDQYYIRYTRSIYQYSVKYYNSDSDYCWVNAEYYTQVSGGMNNYYYYAFPKMSGYSKMQFFVYSSDMTQGQEEEYLVATDYLTLSGGYDTFALTNNGNNLSYSWTNYTTSTKNEGRGGFGGMGGMGGGNTDKGDYSTKGIKADNEILILAGTVNIKSYDDAVHASSGTSLENGETSLGNVTVSGGAITAYSNDDGLHADGTLTVSGGSVCVTNSYEGLEGDHVVISGGYVSIIASDDGINGTATSGTAVAISAGMIYIYCSGDGIDSNSRSSYQGISFSGGNTVVISNSNGNSAIDTEQGYEYTGGQIVAIMPNGGMTNEPSNCSNFSRIGTRSNVSLKSGSYLTVSVSGKTIVTVKMPTDISACVFYLGSKSASVSSGSGDTDDLDQNGVYWSQDEGA